MRIKPVILISLIFLIACFQNCGSGFEGSINSSQIISSSVTSPAADSVTAPHTTPQPSANNSESSGANTTPSQEPAEPETEPTPMSTPSFSVVQAEIKNVTASSFTMEWSLSEFGSGQVFYGETTGLGQASLKEVSFQYKDHRQEIKNLKENTTYHVKVVSVNERGDEAIKTGLSFKTLKQEGGATAEPIDPEEPAAPTNTNYKYPPSQTQPSTSVKRVLSPPNFGQTLSGDMVNTTVRGVSREGDRHQYSRRPAWNSDETVLYVGEKAFRVSDLSLIRDIKTMMSTEWYPSHKNPDVIYGTVGSRFLKGIISTGKVELIVDVGENILLGNFEGGISSNDRYALVDSPGGRLRVIDILEKKVASGPYTIAGNINGADISHDGNYLVWTAGGVTYFSDRNFNKVTKTGFTTPHSDLCVDVNGDQVYVMFTSSDEIVLLRLKDSLVHRKKIFYTGNGHVSCTNYKRPGWVYGSAHRGGELAFSLKLDYLGTPTYEVWGSTHQYLVDYNNAPYNPQPKLSASPSGTQVMFTSEWNQKTKYRDFVIRYNQ